MDDEPTVGGGKKTVMVGQQSVEVTDPLHVMPVAVDVLTEFRLIGGVVHLSLASYIWDGTGPPEARVCARLRLPLELASGIQNMIENAVGDANKAREAAN